MVYPSSLSGDRHCTVPSVGRNSYTKAHETLFNDAYINDELLRYALNGGFIGRVVVAFYLLFDAQRRRLCSGKTLAFQAKDAGSIPARRSNFSDG